MIPSHHPNPETLISYASGTLPNAIACIVACHLSMCRECANEIRWLERLAGVMLSRLEPADDSPALAAGQGDAGTRPAAALRCAGTGNEYRRSAAAASPDALSQHQRGGHLMETNWQWDRRPLA